MEKPTEDIKQVRKFLEKCKKDLAIQNIMFKQKHECYITMSQAMMGNLESLLKYFEYLEEKRLP